MAGKNWKACTKTRKESSGISQHEGGRGNAIAAVGTDRWKVKLNPAVVSLASNQNVSAMCKEGLLMDCPRKHWNPRELKVLETSSVSLSVSPPTYYSPSETVPPKLRLCTDFHSYPEFKSASGDCEQSGDFMHSGHTVSFHKKLC